MSRRTLNCLGCGLVAAASVAVAPLALAGNGPYVGLEAGGNWVANETYSGALGHQKKDVFGAEGGLVGGYSFANGLRPELELTYRWNELRSGNGLSQVPALMANLWYDFSLPSSWGLPRLHPYVGGGVGFGRIDPILTNVAPGSDYRSVFLYQGGAGLDFDVTRHLTASVGWRWIQSSHANFQGPGSHSGTGRYRANTALLSVRYSFGSTPAPAPVAPPPPPAQATAPVPPPPPVAANPNRKFENVHFAFDKSNLSDYAKASLNGDAKSINKLATQYPDLQVDVSGNTDWIGTSAYNQALSERRANSVRDYLQMQGVDATRIHTFAYGETRPVAPNTTAEGRALNRRAQVRTHSASPATQH
ncbi:MAG TPA: OmpA family protein [Nevskiaceae bacterium]|nr:OmpA family protein [Nevskiaceae bacterium]